MTDMLLTVPLFTCLKCLQIIVNLKGLIRHFPLILLSLVNFIKPANIEKIEVHSPSFSCQKMEIIVTMKNGEERKCLNPEPGAGMLSVQFSIWERWA
uniref:Chemokine interleukin-8-like domain-containing protein n=1 Tax=Paramormyrops kingsleyae TaxID=1676925 RepID=A0A3B3REV8_9TELE